MTLKTKSIYDEKEKSDGTRVLVTRFYPRGVKRTHFDAWIRHLSPEAKLLKAYKKGEINWREFSKQFRHQIRTSPDSKRAVLEIVDLLGKSGDVTLLCYEKEGQNCHRYILKTVVDRAAVKQVKTDSEKKVTKKAGARSRSAKRENE